VNREEINHRILSLVADSATATSLSCRQAASYAAHFFVTRLVEIGASLPREHPEATADTLSLVGRITEKTIADAIRHSSDRHLELAFERLSEFGFANLVVDAGNVHHLRTIPCLLTNPYHMDEPALLSLRQNEIFTKPDYARLFEELIEIVQSSGLILCSVVIDNLAAQSSGLDETLLNTASPVIHIHCFAHMATPHLTSYGESCPSEQSHLTALVSGGERPY
jgi:hypothetical protein